MTEDNAGQSTSPLSLRAYARHRQVSLPAVQKAIQSGRITTTADGKINTKSADAEWERNTAPKPQHRTSITPLRQRLPSAAPSASPINYAVERAIRERIRVRRETIELRKLEEKLISRDEVQVAAFNRGRVLRDGMLNIADRIAAQLAAESDPNKVHETLTLEIRRALLEFADRSNG
jgi:hypothetical protein